MILDISVERTAAPNKAFEALADDEQIQRTARGLEARNIKVLIAENGAEAKRMFLNWCQKA